jgi:hypothetical protein
MKISESASCYFIRIFHTYFFIAVCYYFMNKTLLPALLFRDDIYVNNKHGERHFAW